MDLFPAGHGQSSIVKIKYTGSRPEGHKAANIAGGFGSTQDVPEFWTCPHSDDDDLI